MNKTKYLDSSLIIETLTQDYEALTFTFLYAAIFLFGIVANLAVIFVYLSQKSLNKHTTVFFISLSLSDILVLIVCIPISISDLYIDEWNFGLIYCKFLISILCRIFTYHS